METIGRAVVVGGSVAGLTAAAALASRAAEVVVVERREFPAAGTVTSIAAQGPFPHGLLAGGARTLEGLFPGLVDELFARGAANDLRGPRPVHWWAQGTVRRHLPDLGIPTPLCSRALLESRLRDRLRTLPNVTLAGGTGVGALRLVEGRVRGISAQHGQTRLDLDADLVVDATGRGAAATTWLRAAGVPEPPVTQVRVDITYTVVDVRRHPGDVHGGIMAVVQNTADLPRIGVALPAEGPRWQVLLGGYFGDAAVPTRDGMLAYAGSLPDPVIQGVLENEWVGEPAQFRFRSSQRREWTKVRMPAGLCAVGDAVASFNPLYGQGMSTAALQAEALGACIDRHGNSAALPAAVARATAKAIANPWLTATGADFIYPQTRGPKPAGTDLVNRYVAKVLRAAARDDEVNLAFTRVSNLLSPPASLFAPAVVRRVRRSGRQAVAVPSRVPEDVRP